MVKPAPGAGSQAISPAAASRLVHLRDGNSRAVVYPEQGFQLHRFACGLADGRVVDLVFGPADGREPPDRRYGNPVLFPSVGVTSGEEPERWRHGADGRWLPMQQHGWARDAYWHVLDVSPTSVAAVLVPPTGMRTSFPFDLTLQLRYTLIGATLVLDAELSNRGSASFPYALGFHPYLRAPVGAQAATMTAAATAPTAAARTDCRVRLPAGIRLRSDDGWRSIARSPSPARVIAASERELPGSIVLAETGAPALEVVDATEGVTTRVSIEGSEESFPVWVVWSAGADAPYVCLEPWTDAPNALNRAETRRLEGGATHRYRMTIEGRATPK